MHTHQHPPLSYFPSKSRAKMREMCGVPHESPSKLTFGHARDEESELVCEAREGAELAAAAVAAAAAPEFWSSRRVLDPVVLLLKLQLDGVWCVVCGVWCACVRARVCVCACVCVFVHVGVLVFATGVRICGASSPTSS